MIAVSLDSHPFCQEGFWRKLRLLKPFQARLWMVQVRVLTPAGEAVEFPLPGSRVTLDSVRAELCKHLKGATPYPLLLRNGSIFGRDIVLETSDDVTFTLISKSDFPEKGFARADYAFTIDDLRFPCHPSVEDFPDTELPGQARTNRNERVRAVVADITQRVFGSNTFRSIASDFDFSNANLDYYPYVQVRRRRRARCISAEEEDGDPGAGSEEEDVETVMEMRDDFEVSLSPEHEAMVTRLADLGFDRSLVTPLLFLMQGNENLTRSLMEAVLPGF
jgi:hypothetical protein